MPPEVVSLGAENHKIIDVIVGPVPINVMHNVGRGKMEPNITNCCTSLPRTHIVSDIIRVLQVCMVAFVRTIMFAGFTSIATVFRELFIAVVANNGLFRCCFGRVNSMLSKIPPDSGSGHLKNIGDHLHRIKIFVPHFNSFFGYC